MNDAARPPAHELNTSFAWADHAGPYRAVTPAQARQYDEQGFFVLEDALDPGEVAALVATIDPFEARQEEALRAMEGGRFFIARADEITFTTHLVLRSALLRDFTASALFADLCADLVGPDARLYWDQAVYKKPGTESPFPWHQDNGYAFVEPQQYLTCWVALTDATEDNGCPWVVPGLHRLGTLAHEYSDIGFVCLREPAHAVAVAGARREHRRLLVVDAALHGPEPHRRGAQGLHRAIRTDRGHGDPGWAGRGHDPRRRGRRIPAVRGVARRRAGRGLGEVPHGAPGRAGTPGCGPAPTGAPARAGEPGVDVVGRLGNCVAVHVVSLLSVSRPGDLPSVHAAPSGCGRPAQGLGPRSQHGRVALGPSSGRTRLIVE